jgi:hypothetical protein
MWSCLNGGMTDSISTQQDAPHIYFVRRHAGIAGQFSVSARVGYADEPPRDVEFIGSVYGGPVVMRTGTLETFVSDPGRFGRFGEDWVRRFLGDGTEG